jgi:hypothetical protein
MKNRIPKSNNLGRTAGKKTLCKETARQKMQSTFLYAPQWKI